MSIKVMSALWENSRHDGTHLLVLLALADWANDDGETFPAIATLARKCRVNERRLQQILKDLSTKDPNDPDAPEPELEIFHRQGSMMREMRERLPRNWHGNAFFKPNLYVVKPPPPRSGKNGSERPESKPPGAAGNRDESSEPESGTPPPTHNGAPPSPTDPRQFSALEEMQTSAPGVVQEIAPGDVVQKIAPGAISRADQSTPGAENCTTSSTDLVQKIAPNTSYTSIDPIYTSEGESAAAAAPPPPTPAAAPASNRVQKTPGLKTRRTPPSQLSALEDTAAIIRRHCDHSPHLHGATFDADGYIALGTGTNPVQWWYEWFSILKPDERLDARQEDVLMQRCPHDARTRRAIEAHKLNGHKKAKNLNLIIDWAEHPERIDSNPTWSTQANVSRPPSAARPSQPERSSEDDDATLMAAFKAREEKLRAMSGGGAQTPKPN